LSTTLLVVENPANWPLTIPGVEIVPARSYLTDEHFSSLRRAKVFNLCRSYRYQSLGYYVSLLAAARGHKPIPSVTTIQDLKTQTIIRTVSDDIDTLIQKSLSQIRSPKFTLSIYFGRNVARRYDRLSSYLFRLFEAPLLQVQFVHRENWEVQNINPLSLSEIPDHHRKYVTQFAEEYLAGKRTRSVPRTTSRYDLAILRDPGEKNPPSDEKAIRKFVRAAENAGFATEIIDRRDYGRLAEFDALFIRDTTSVNHYTYRFARRAAAEGLVVIDDPESILRCTNKVYLAELLPRHRVTIPKTLVLGKDNVARVAEVLGFPCILKQPDSSFSQGVSKVNSREELESECERLLERSELIIAQEFLPTSFDWRVGVLDGEPLYACRYFMAHRHWQIIRTTSSGLQRGGRVEAVPIEEAPTPVVQAAVRTARLVGNGLYGVDVKEGSKKAYVIEINDNPSIDAGYEDAILKDELYRRIIRSILRRLEERRNFRERGPVR